MPKKPLWEKNFKKIEEFSGYDGRGDASETVVVEKTLFFL